MLNLEGRKMERVMGYKQNRRKNESGNVLFLILIAVALFAALSYAVTQSTRSGGGSTEREKATLSSASMTQHPTGMRTAIIRMVLSGVDVASIAFNSPANFSGVSEELLVFHPNGGAAVYQQAPSDLMSSAGLGTWFYNVNWDIPQIGTDGGGGNDVIAFLPGITQAVCKQTNAEFAISVTDCTSNDSVVPDLNAATTNTNIRDDMDDSYTLPVGDQEDLQNASCTAFTGQPSGCFYDSDAAEYVFYSVLLER